MQQHRLEYLEDKLYPQQLLTLTSHFSLSCHAPHGTVNARADGHGER